MIFNEAALKFFDCSITDEITADNEFPIWKRTDPFGRDYYGVSHFYNSDENIEKDTDLSWLEWDGNEINIDNAYSDDTMQLFRKTMAIMKSWKEQLKEQFPGERFVILASFDAGSELNEESDSYQGFTLRFWKSREGQGYEENSTWDQPCIISIVE